MRDKSLPPELTRFNYLPDLKYRGSDEWSSACPHCGGADRSRSDLSDRFRLFDRDSQRNARVWCRNCGHFEWADQNSDIPSKEQLEEIKRERTRLAELERQRIKTKIEQLRSEAYWRGWHDAMSDWHRDIWRHQGIRDDLQDYFQLGYVEKRRFFDGAKPFYSPAMTIPVFDVGWEAVNVQYRLMEPPSGVGKYRFTSGLPTPLFLTNPYTEPAGDVLLVEGAKKAIVTFDKLDDLCIVAVPSKVPPLQILDRLDQADAVYIALDPDAYCDKRASAAYRIGKALGNKARYVRLPTKPDDFFTMYGGSQSQFMRYVRQATRSIQ